MRWAADGVRRKLKRGFTYMRAWVHRRQASGVTFVGITGSAGKTTTKDLAAAILASLGKCESTTLSENEHLYVAQTILSATRRHRFCVVEVGAQGPGYLDFSIRLVKPSVAVLTLIARDHFKAFRSIEAIAAEKAKLIAALPPDGTAVLNMDDALVRRIGEACNRRVIWVGTSAGAAIRLLNATSRWPEPLTLEVEHAGRVHRIATRLHGTHLALPVVAALGVAQAVGMPLDDAITALGAVEAPEGRMQIVEAPDGVTFVRDDWKAPHWSLNAPLQFMREAKAKRKVLVIGTISDFSLSSSKVYPKVAREARAIGELVVFVGPNATLALKARPEPDDTSIQAFRDIRDAATFLRDALQPGDLVLLKGSHKADHLVRLVLDRSTHVGCWRSHCGIAKFCGACRHLATDEDNAPTVRSFTSFVKPDAVAHAAADVHVVVGLGNPGSRYESTAHNVGQRALDALAAAHGARWEQQPEGMVASLRLGDTELRLLKPAGNMNVSGPMVQRYLARVGVDADRCMLVHDDVDLAIGDVRLKRDGGDAGHRGVRSVIAALGTGRIDRVRIGVRRAGDARKAREFVLAPFRADEEIVLAPALARATALMAETLAARPVADARRQTA